MTGDQLAAIAAAGAPTVGSGAPRGSSTSGLKEADTATTSTSARDNVAPVVHINGNNPAPVQVGVSYQDFGATSLARRKTSTSAYIYILRAQLQTPYPSTRARPAASRQRH